MPCLTPDLPPPTMDEMNAIGEMTHGQLEAVLCGVFRAYGAQSVIENVSWKQAGVKSEVVRKWWIKHQEKDRQRELREKGGEA